MNNNVEIKSKTQAKPLKATKPDKQTKPSIPETPVANDPAAYYGNSLHLDENKRYSYADYLTWTDDKLRELHEGFVRVMSAPTFRHAEISSNIFYFIKNIVFKRKGKCKVLHAPIDVRFPKEGKKGDKDIYTVFQPDICVICDMSKIDERGCIGAPDLIVEVQSPSTAKFDMDEKFHVYESAGVKEYWIVFPKDKAITAFILQDDGKYGRGTAYEYDAKVPVHIFKGLKIGLKDLFED